MDRRIPGLGFDSAFDFAVNSRQRSGFENTNTSNSNNSNDSNTNDISTNKNNGAQTNGNRRSPIYNVMDQQTVNSGPSGTKSSTPVTSQPLWSLYGVPEISRHEANPNGRGHNASAMSSANNDNNSGIGGRMDMNASPLNSAMGNVINDSAMSAAMNSSVGRSILNESSNLNNNTNNSAGAGLSAPKPTSLSSSTFLPQAGAVGSPDQFLSTFSGESQQRRILLMDQQNPFGGSGLSKTGGYSQRSSSSAEMRGPNFGRGNIMLKPNLARSSGLASMSTDNNHNLDASTSAGRLYQFDPTSRPPYSAPLVSAGEVPIDTTDANKNPGGGSIERGIQRPPSTTNRMLSPNLMADEMQTAQAGAQYGTSPDPVCGRRLKFKAKSSIPADLSTSHYAAQCAAAAVSSRLDPYSLHIEEYDLLRSYLPYVHVTTYLNIRNGILRLWMSNPTVSVTMAEAAGCARDERFFGLAEFAYEWLLRNGYINFGCVECPFPNTDLESFDDRMDGSRPLKPRPTIIVIGAGVAGLGMARQLDSLCKQYASRFSKYEEIPRIIVLEGRRRIGGRIYSAPLKTDKSAMMDLGAHIIMGFGAGNPLGILVRRQLGLPIEPMAPPSAFYDEMTREQVDENTEKRGDLLYRHLMKRIGQFKNTVRKPTTADGDRVLMHAAKDPTVRDEFQEHQTIAKVEESGDMMKRHEEDATKKKYTTDEVETEEELKFLNSIGIYEKSENFSDDSSPSSSGSSPFQLPHFHHGHKRKIHVVPEPQGDVHPSLGQTLDGAIDQVKDIAQLSLIDVQLLNWHLGNLEYSAGTNLNNLSLASWNQDDGHEFSGRYSVIKNGYQSLMRGLYMYSEPLDVRFNSCVKVIEYDDSSAHVFLENGERIHADKVIVTVPLGVLKDRTIQFIPDLPQWKTDSIERLGFGVTNKVCLIFEEAFWDDTQDIFCSVRAPVGTGTSQKEFEDIRGEFYMFWNCTKAIGKPCLVGLLTGNAANNVVSESDEELVEKAQSIISRVIKNPDGRPMKLVESIVTRWQIDPFSRGSYSYIGLEATGADYDLMARPIGKSVYFAGEATCRTYPGTVHGAYLSGLRVANEVLSSYIGNLTVPYPLILPKEHRVQRMLHHQQQPPHQQKQQHYSGPSSQISSSKGTPSYHPSMMRAVPLRPLDDEDSPYGSSGSAIPGSGVLTGVGDEAFEPPPLSIKRGMETLEAAEADLKRLREERIAHDNERMRHDLIQELGGRPVKPERSGANPFLIFQKDFWEKCRRETDRGKQQTTNDPNARATRNEVRAALGKMWREFPEDDKKPYLEQTASIKEDNNKKNEAFRRKVRQYDSEAEDFRRRWKETNASPPSSEELRLMRIIQESLGESARKRRK